MMIEDLQVAKTFVRWPFQHVRRISTECMTLNFQVEAIYKEKLPFTIPATFSIGIKNNPIAVADFARRIAPDNDIDETMEVSYPIELSSKTSTGIRIRFLRGSLSY